MFTVKSPHNKHTHAPHTHTDRDKYKRQLTTFYASSNCKLSWNQNSFYFACVYVVCVSVCICLFVCACVCDCTYILINPKAKQMSHNGPTCGQMVSMQRGRGGCGNGSVSVSIVITCDL